MRLVQLLFCIPILQWKKLRLKFKKRTHTDSHSWLSDLKTVIWTAFSLTKMEPLTICYTTYVKGPEREGPSKMRFEKSFLAIRETVLNLVIPEKLQKKRYESNRSHGNNSLTHSLFCRTIPVSPVWIFIVFFTEAELTQTLIIYRCMKQLFY